MALQAQADGVQLMLCSFVVCMCGVHHACQRSEVSTSIKLLSLAKINSAQSAFMVRTTRHLKAIHGCITQHDELARGGGA
jgi:hypothetical protein